LANEPSSTPRPQRVWRAACPGCGAPVDFASAASASAVCSFCRSTLLREGEVLRRIGVSAELFEDHSPLQLGATGRHQGVAFSVVGRLQYRYAEGSWNEWHVLFDAAADATPKPAWLSEDNGAYVLSFDQPPLADAPAADELHPGERRLVAGSAWSVASVQQASLAAALGELPRPPLLQGSFTVADLRNERGEVGTLDYSHPTAPLWAVGRSVSLAELAMQGLREGPAEATLAGRQIPCPSCGAPLAPTLASTRSISCGQCHAVVDLSQGAGADLQHYAQHHSGESGLMPQIPLGRSGRLALGADGPLDWQVVGYQERCDVPADADDEQSFWREYLLFHRSAGFAFLVDAEDGWSWVRPVTGVPQLRGQQAKLDGLSYRERYRYAAKVTWVLGEFYWRVQRDEQAEVTDYDGPGGARLSREQTGSEVVWSAGRTLDVKTVVSAFGIEAAEQAAMRRDAAPLSGLGGGASGSGFSINPGLVMVLVVIVVIVLMSRCSSSDDCRSVQQNFGESSAEYQQCLRSQRSGGFSSGGGSFGGFSSGGGGHK